MSKTTRAQQFNKRSFDNLQKAIRKAGKQVDDLRVPLNIIANRFMESRKFIFGLKGAGQFADLSPAYKIQKARKLGSPYPILFYSGELKDSITKQGAKGNIKIVGKQYLELGSSLPYAEWLQKGTRKMPAREFLFWGPESPKFANHRLVVKQNKAMEKILLHHVEKKLEAALG